MNVDDQTLLQDVIRQRAQVGSLLDESYEAAARAEGESLTAYHSLSKLYARLTEDIRRLRGSLARADTAHWEQRRRHIEGGLLRNYEAQGPQYVLLCQQAALAAVHAERLSTMAPPPSPNEVARAQANVASLVNQLQKYTETVKTELIQSEVQRQLMQALAIVEARLAPVQPHLWQEIVEDIADRLGLDEGRASPSGSASPNGLPQLSAPASASAR